MSIIILMTDYCRVHLRVRMVVFVQSVVKRSRIPGKDRYVHAGEFGLTLHDDVSIFVDLCFLHLTVRLGHHQLKRLNVLLVLIVSCQISKEQLLLI